ncbi:radical SAM protein [Actinokineospora auranticolor]|uniref:Radical SAM protein with 4Fe4S-binding SPASM domain n=1 Tax=Actinokineospora auranticolor TaxID=155976 RepID=A0A2S6GIF4_9PSEU|nr:radical SAM protein [Actinokineospora auranticolor]PPK65012.1 radical SAM protein with 4Fe4S-binding SPASM domain [Actinokineospora auranticolor]
MIRLSIEPTTPPLPAAPRYATVFVNWACNLTCRECWLYGDSSSENTWLEEVKREQISLEMWTALVDELAAHNEHPGISMMGGEPLMHPLVLDLVREAKTRAPGCQLDMSTNGTLLPRYAEGLVEGGIDIVYVSLDGPTPEINNPIRGRKSFERVVTGIRALQDACAKAGRGPRIALNFTLTGMNYTSLPGMVRLAEELDIPQVTVDLAMYFTREEGKASRAGFEGVTGRPFLSWTGYCNEHQHADVDQAVLLSVLEEAKSCSDTVEVLVAPVRYNSQEQSTYFTDQWREVVHETTCPKLWAQTTVLPNGDVLSCTPFADTVMGSVRGQSLAEVWGNDVYGRMRELIREKLEPICYRCCELSLDIEVDPALFAKTAQPGETP